MGGAKKRKSDASVGGEKEKKKQKTSHEPKEDKKQMALTSFTQFSPKASISPIRPTTRSPADKRILSEGDESLIESIPLFKESPDSKRKSPRIHKREDDSMNNSEQIDDERINACIENEIALKLLKGLEEQLPKLDKVGYTHTLKRIKWEKLNAPGKSEDECKEMFMHILNKLQVQKTLTTLVAEAKELVRKSYVMFVPKNIPSAYSNFMKDYITKHKTDFNSNMQQVFKEASKVWHAFPEEKKKYYASNFKKDMDKYREERSKTTEFKPYQLWVAKMRSDHPNEVKKYRLKDFKKLSDEAKEPFIRISLEQTFSTRKKLEALKGEKLSKDRKEKDFQSFCTHSELEIYLKLKGLPEVPPYRPQNLFYSEMSDAGKLDHIKGSCEKMLYSMEHYACLPSEKKSDYYKKLQKWHEEFREKLKEWEGKNDEVTIMAKELLWDGPVPKFLRKSSGGTTKRIVVSDHMRKHFPYIIYKDERRQTLEGEPEMPPSSPFQLFLHKFMKSVDEDQFKNKAEMIHVCSEKWKKLDALQISPFLGCWRTMRDRYKEELVEYLAQLPKKRRKIFLGHNRIKVFRIFKEDIFRDVYPNVKYPIYTRNPDEVGMRQQTITELVQVKYTKNYKASKIGTKSSKQHKRKTRLSSISASSQQPLNNGNVQSKNDSQKNKDSPQKQITPVKFGYKKKSTEENYSSSSEDEEDVDDILSPYQERSYLLKPKKKTVRHMSEDEDEESESSSDEEIEGTQVSRSKKIPSTPQEKPSTQSLLKKTPSQEKLMERATKESPKYPHLSPKNESMDMDERRSPILFDTLSHFEPIQNNASGLHSSSEEESDDETQLVMNKPVQNNASLQASSSSEEESDDETQLVMNKPVQNNASLQASSSSEEESDDETLMVIKEPIQKPSLQASSSSDDDDDDDCAVPAWRSPSFSQKKKLNRTEESDSDSDSD